ncbi:MAG: endonuclease domain-containing protein [Gemmatales bacterium]
MATKTHTQLRTNAKALRSTMTDTEQFVWYHLRARRFQGYKFRRQVPIGRFVVDFICFESKLIVELDGGQHAEQQPYDEARTQYLEQSGYRVLRFWNHDVLKDWEVVEEVIWRALQASDLHGDGRSSPCPLTPNPSPSRGEGNQTRGVGNYNGEDDCS